MIRTGKFKDLIRTGKFKDLIRTGKFKYFENCSNDSTIVHYNSLVQQFERNSEINQKILFFQKLNHKTQPVFKFIEKFLREKIKI